MKDFARKALPQSLRSFLRRVYYDSSDFAQRLAGMRDPLTPPTRMIRMIGAGDFRKVGEDFLRLFVEIGGLKRTDAVLDVGCGVGRMAIPLTAWLEKGARYEGFDIAADEIRWCRKQIAGRFPNFRFHHADVFNRVYNPSGRFKASEYRFPFGDAEFDFVFLTSVFTHMLPADLEHYLEEIARVLKTGGRAFITYFILNDESIGLVRHGRSSLAFTYDLQGCKIIDPAAPESAIAYPEPTVRTLNAKHGLTVLAPIRYGSWCGRQAHTTYQDVVVAVKQ